MDLSSEGEKNKWPNMKLQKHSLTFWKYVPGIFLRQFYCDGDTRQNNS